MPKLPFFILFDCLFKTLYPFCLFFYIALCPMFPYIQLFVCLAACRPRICSRNLCLHFQLFATFFFVCWSQNAASLVLLRSPMQRQSGSNIGNFQKIIDFQKIAFAMCNLQCQWRTLFSQIKQTPST